MSFRPSIVLLFDLDLLLIDERDSRRDVIDDGLSSVADNVACRLRRLSNRILNDVSEKQGNIQWGYRFYSSCSYQHTNKAGFQDLNKQSLDDFEEALEARFEQRQQQSSTSCKEVGKMSRAAVLGRTLQDIATDYDWKTKADTLTPTRKQGGKKLGKREETSLQNCVFIFTRVPSDNDLAAFCNFPAGKAVDKKIVGDSFLAKDLVKKFNELNLVLSFVDYSHPSQCRIFSEIAVNLRGAVIDSRALLSSFSFSHIINACSKRPNVDTKQLCYTCQTLKLSSLITLKIGNSYMQANVQCCSHNCCLSSQDHSSSSRINSLNCLSVNADFAGGSMLQYDSLYFLSSSHFTQFSSSNILVGVCSETAFMISSFHRQSATLVRPTSPLIVNMIKSLLNQGQFRRSTEHVKSFVDRVITTCSANGGGEKEDAAESQMLSLPRFQSHFIDKKATLLPTHWQLLKDSFQPSCTVANDGLGSADGVGENNVAAASNCEPVTTKAVNDAVCDQPVLAKKLGHQGLRACQLLAKSQEVRARNDATQREKLTREKQAADERRMKRCVEMESYLSQLRAENQVPEAAEASPETLLKRLIDLTKRSFTCDPPLQDWQLYCISQVTVTCILNAFHEPVTAATAWQKAAQTIRKSLFIRPAAVGRQSATKEARIAEYKLQVLVRFELAWLTGSCEERLDEQLVQESASLMQLLAIHGDAKLMSLFVQDILVANYENMLTELLTNLLDELNLPMPETLAELVSADKSSQSKGSGSPAALRSVPSVQSHSQADQRAQQQQRQQQQQQQQRQLRPRQAAVVQQQSRKQIALPARNEVKPVVEVAPAKKEKTCQVGRVRRSLHFGGGETTPLKSSSKSPSDLAPAAKRANKTQATPDLSTPSKNELVILAPETPSRLRSAVKVRKSDGVNVVGESPEVKQEALRRSPRRLEAALALRRKASFYKTLDSASSAGASRHWARAESQVWSDKTKPAEDHAPSQTRAPVAAQFLFSKILSRNDSGVSELLATPSKSIVTGGVDPWAETLATPLKTSPVATGVAASLAVMGQFGMTPVKTPARHVQFNMSLQPATPSGKNASCTKSILKSPAPEFMSPARRSKRVLYVLDEKTLKDDQQLHLQSPAKVMNNSQSSQSGGVNNAENEPMVNGWRVTPVKMAAVKTTTVEMTPDKITPVKMTPIKTTPVKMTLVKTTPMKTTPIAGCSSMRVDTTPELVPESAIHAMDDNMCDEELQLISPVKSDQPVRQEEPVDQEEPIDQEKPVDRKLKTKVSPLVLRRSPRANINNSLNFFQRNPNWTVIDYRRRPGATAAAAAESVRKSLADADGDPYDFNEDDEKQPANMNCHKRKLFSSIGAQSDCKRRKTSANAEELVAAVAVPDLTTPGKGVAYQVPLESSLFHLENSPLLTRLERKT